MIKRTLWFLIVIACIVVVGVFVSKKSFAPESFNSAAFLNSLARQLPKEENFPEPLQRLGNAAAGIKTETLTTAKAIELTNAERASDGKKALTKNAKLAKAAESKIDDLFSQQYFEHISPQGRGPAEIIQAAGYQYVMVGENLAEGDFATTADLISGWMNSPGHRANILNEKYTEIGMAVRRGTYQGNVVWMAVQEFGKPRSDCPEIEESLKANISENELQIKTWQSLIEKMTAELSAYQKSGDATSYNALVPKYNDLVAKVNSLISETKVIVSRYNAEVQSFNACVQN